MGNPIFFDNDGGIDDFQALLLLLLSDKKEKNLVAIFLADGNCFVRSAIRTTYKMLKWFDRLDVHVLVTPYHGQHQFPNEWRIQQNIANYVPQLINVDPDAPDFSDIKLKDKDVDPVDYMLRFFNNKETMNKKVDILATGPATNIGRFLNKYPKYTEMINKVVWMAGAVHVNGNVSRFDQDGSAEWNVFWDADAAADLFSVENLNLILCPLDVTNQGLVDETFLKELSKVHSEYGQFALILWAISFSQLTSPKPEYYMWDPMAFFLFQYPEIFKTKKEVMGVPDSTLEIGRTKVGHDHAVLTEYAYSVDYPNLLDKMKKLLKNE
ncbi:hypothetical protein SNEBB_009943 [Seison nebaliae]|nr:hypothetical protein SNEBB_009943 [Seison nebaliae]